MGRSSRFSGPFAAFSLPLGAAVTCSADGVVCAFAAAGVGALVHIPSASPCVVGVCASSWAGESERAASASKGMGDAVLGVPGDESGESAMVVLGRAGTASRHAGSPGRCRGQAQEQHGSTTARRSHVHEGLPASRGVAVVHQKADYQSNVVGQETLATLAHIRNATPLPSQARPFPVQPSRRLRPTRTLLMASQEPLAQTTKRRHPCQACQARQASAATMVQYYSNYKLAQRPTPCRAGITSQTPNVNTISASIHVSTPTLVSAALYIQCCLPALRIAHLDDLDIPCPLHVGHCLRRNEDKLSSNRPSSSFDDQIHTDVAIDAVHENVATNISLCPPRDHDLLLTTHQGSGSANPWPPKERVEDTLSSRISRHRTTSWSVCHLHSTPCYPVGPGRVSNMVNFTSTFHVHVYLGVRSCGRYSVYL